jgi:hypothetical protein
MKLAGGDHRNLNSEVVLGFSCTQWSLRRAAAPVDRLGLASAPFFP